MTPRLTRLGADAGRQVEVEGLERRARLLRRQGVRQAPVGLLAGPSAATGGDTA